MQGERNSLQTTLADVRRGAAEASEAHERLALEWQAEARAREAAVLEAKAREVAEALETGHRCVQSLFKTLGVALKGTQTA
jgi:hypothetical protein